MKILEKNRIIEKDDEIRARREFDMLTKFIHPNVILISEIFEISDSFYTVMEFCEGGELFNYIVKNKRLSEEEAAFFYYQLIIGLEYLHSLGIAHRNLKPENLLLTNDHILKIIDFRLSNYFTKDPEQKLLITQCGSPCYASPEMVAGKKYNGFKVDIWATGIILYAMLCGYLPFEDKSNYALFKKILECKVKYPRYIGDKPKDLIQKILVNDPEERISIEEIKKHPFFVKGKNVFEQNFIIIRIEDKENKDSILNANEKENKKILLNDDNFLVTKPKEAKYKTLKTENIDKSYQFYSDFQNSDQGISIAIEEKDKNEKDKIKEKKNEEKEKEKEKNENFNQNSKNKIKAKNKKETSIKKTLLRDKSKSKELIYNPNLIRKNRENYLRKNNFFRITSKLKVHKTNTHSNLKKKGYSVSLTNIIKKNSNQKTIRKEKHKFNININNINNISNYTNNDMNKNKGILDIQMTSSDQKKKKLKVINISKNNRTSKEKKKVYLETDIKKIKKKLLNKQLNKKIELHSNKSESNKFYEDDLDGNNRILKTENNSINVEENSKMKRTINSKNSSTINTVNFFTHTSNTKNHKNNNINKIKQKKNYVVDFKNNDKDININNKNEINKLKDEIIELKTRLKELEKSLKEKDNIIKNLKNERKEMLNKNKKLNIENNNINKKLSQLNLESKEQISKKEKIIKEYKLKISQFHFEFSPGEKIMSIIFISSDENIITSFICKNTDIFKFIENKFYEKYSEYKDLDNIFILNGKKINKNKSLDENKIKNNDIITII